MAVTQETTTRPTNDAYTGMLGISLFALILGCVLLYLDYSQYPDSKGPAIPKAPTVAAGDLGVKGQEPKELPPMKKKTEEAKDSPAPETDEKK